jgi:hypothetical protein
MCVTIHLQFNCNSFTIQKTRIFDKKRQRKKKKNQRKRTRKKKKSVSPFFLCQKKYQQEYRLFSIRLLTFSLPSRPVCVCARESTVFLKEKKKKKQETLD